MAPDRTLLLANPARLEDTVMRDELGIPHEANTHIGKGEQCAPGSGRPEGAMSRQGRARAAEAPVGRQARPENSAPAEGPLKMKRHPAGRAVPDVLIDYIRVQVCDLQSTFKTQPCIFSEVPWIDAEPL
jgi:hypothetical protein